LTDRFEGFGIMGQPFRSGHVLAMRKFDVSSIGPGYTSVWHRSPDGSWTFFQDQPAEYGCARYFGDGCVQTAIEVERTSDSVRVSVPEVALEWRSTLRSSAVTTVMNALGSVMPDSWWRSPGVLRAMGAVAGPAMGAGKVGLAGISRNGQRFVANPLKLRLVDSVTATLRGEELGPPGPLAEQAALGDFRIPQRGVFADGRAFFDEV
jgi:hypothetical protein